MGRKKYGFDESRIQRFIKEGRGKGRGPQYKPWFTAADVPSLGRVHRIFCPKVGREMHFLSDNEYYAFLCLWWDDDVVDIREQYPLLDRKETLQLAAQLGIKYPLDPASGALWVMTTDLLVTRRSGGSEHLEAFAIKDSTALSDARTLDKLDIERAYWEKRGITWTILTNEEVKSVYTRNLAWILDSQDSADNGADDLVFTTILAMASGRHTREVRYVCLDIDRRLALPDGTSLRALRRLLAQKRIRVDLDTRDIPDMPVSAFSSTRDHV